MTAKEYLMQIRHYEKMMIAKSEEVKQLRDIATSIKAVTYDEDRVQTSPVPDRIGEAIMRIMESEEEVAKIMDEYRIKRQQIIEQIEGLENNEYCELLHLRYVSNKKFEQIASIMHFTFRNIQYMHGRALVAFEEKYLKK